MRTNTHLGCALLLSSLFIGCTVHARTMPRHDPGPEADQPSSPGPSTAATLGIPPGHLPPPGQCRVWIPGAPPGRQARSTSCSGLERVAPAGSWIVYRPGRNKKIVEVRQVDAAVRGVIVGIRIYEADTGRLVRVEATNHQ